MATDLSVLTAALDFSGVVEAVLVVGAALVGLNVLMRAITMVLRSIHTQSVSMNRDDYVMGEFLSGSYMPRDDFERIFSRLDRDEARRYARKMAKYW